MIGDPTLHMEIGFGLVTCQRYPGDARSDVHLYREALELAEEAEGHGYDSIWLSEHHFLDDAYMPSLLPVCAAMAARTSRIEIGTGLLLAPLYDPLHLAEDAATVDLVSGGRLLLGLGQGWRAEEFDALGIPLAGRHRRFEDTVAVLRQAWSDGLVTGGDIVSYPGVPVTPKPARPGGPPIWIGARAEKAVRRAGRIADGFMATAVTVETYKRQAGWLRDELARRGAAEGSFTFCLYLPTFAWHGSDAWERVREHAHYSSWKYEDMENARARTGPPPAPPPLTAAREAALRAAILVGPAQEIVERIRAYEEAAGGDFHFIARSYWPGIDPGVQRETMAVFAEDVMPALR
jgi:probable F420-dependent oxidoreductase